MPRSESKIAAVLRWALPIVVLALSVIVARAMILSRELPAPEPSRAEPRQIVAVRAEPEVATLQVRAQGSVRPKTVTSLVAQVGGNVRAVSPLLESGGFFDAGTVLVEIEPRDFELAVTQAGARLATMRLALAIAERDAKLAIDEWKRVMGDVEPDPLARHEPQLARANADVAAAEAALEKAQLDLKRTKVVAPYAGRASRRLVDVGQVVMPGTTLAVVHDTRRAEVRVAVPDPQLAFLDLPAELGRAQSVRGPRVVLRARFGGQERSWRGRIVRVEDEIDAQTRMVRLVVGVEDPYARRDETSRPPLPFGLFVEATIEGKRVAGVVPLPRRALRSGTVVWIVDESERLRSREVSVLRTERDRVLIDRGLSAGDRVCVSPIETFVEGMAVRVAAEASR